MVSENSVCMGCFVNNPYGWLPYGYGPREYELYLEALHTGGPRPTFGYSANPTPGLTAEEKDCLKHLADAWNIFVQLQGKHPQDDSEFCTAIHAAQKAIALRVARRVDTDVWSQYPKEVE